MKLRCINTEKLAFGADAQHILTEGLVYDGVPEMSSARQGYRVQLPHYADGLWFYAERFEQVRGPAMHTQAEIVIAHPYTVLVWTKDRGFQPCGLVFKTAEAVFGEMSARSYDETPMYVHTPTGCMYTPNAIKTLGLNLWKEVNGE